MQIRRSRLFFLPAALLLLSACSIPQPYQPPSRPASVPGSAGQPPQNGAAGSNVPGGNVPPAQGTELPPAPAPRTREYTLGPASKALVAQAQSQQASGDYATAAASLERALRIEPNNPLLWLELSKLRQVENNYVQAESLARKALSKAGGDAKVQAAACHAVADALKARGRNQEAREAEVRAETLRP